MALIRILLVSLAVVLFGVAAYLSGDLAHKLTNAALFALAVAYAMTIAG